LLVAGFVRHAIRHSGRDAIESLPDWMRRVYPIGIALILLAQILLGVWGWEGSLQIGFWPAYSSASLLILGLISLTPRLHLLNPIRAHWLRPASSWLDGLYHNLWAVYQVLGRISLAVTSTLEGAGGIMWTLLFLVLFISVMTKGTP
jgi:hypothetical protein